MNRVLFLIALWLLSLMKYDPEDHVCYYINQLKYYYELKFKKHDNNN